MYIKTITRSCCKGRVTLAAFKTKSALLLVCDPFISKNNGMKGNFSNISARLLLTVCTMILRFLDLARLCASDAL